MMMIMMMIENDDKDDNDDGTGKASNHITNNHQYPMIKYIHYH